MSPENPHKLMGFYMEVVTLGDILQYTVSAFKLFRIGCIGLNSTSIVIWATCAQRDVIHVGMHHPL